MQGELASRATRWLVAHLDAFRMRGHGGREKLRAVKRLAELAEFASVAPSSERWIVEMVWRELDKGDAIREVLPLDPAISVAYLPFVRAGWRSPTLEAEIRGALSGHERWHALRRFAVGSVLEAFDSEPPWDMRATLRRLFGAERASSFEFHVAVIAHVVMWQTSKEARRTHLASIHQQEIRAGARRCATILLSRQAIDPLCELVIANALVGGAPLALWANIRGAQRDDGAVRPTPHAPETFADLYHSTLVAAMAAYVEPQQETSWVTS